MKSESLAVWNQGPWEERAQPEAAGVEQPPGFRIGDQRHLKAPVEPESVDDVRLDPPSGSLVSFEEVQLRPRASSSCAQARPASPAPTTTTFVLSMEAPASIMPGRSPESCTGHDKRPASSGPLISLEDLSQAEGTITVSMTWITPFEAITSVLTTLALLIITVLPETTIAMSEP